MSVAISNTPPVHGREKNSFLRTLKKLNSKKMRIIMYAILGIYTLVMIFPFAWMISSSLKTRREMFTIPFGMPEEPQWQNWVDAWNSGLSGFFVNSLIVTAIAVITIIIVSGLASYAIARQNFKGSATFYLLVIVAYAVPFHAVLVPLYQMLDSANMLNSYPGLILPYVAFGIPFSVMLLYSFFVDFPKELEEAARLDGCSQWQVFRHVMMPLSMPGISSVAIFQGVFIWNEFLLASLIMTDSSMKTLPAGMAAFQGQYASNWPVMMACVSIATIVPLLIYISMQKHFVRSLAGLGK